jgi:alkylmercury lyase
MTNAPDINELADRLTAAMPRLDTPEQQIAVALIRELGLGAPVSVSQLATAAGLSETQTAQTLERFPGVFRDEEQRIVGFMGLTVIEMGHHRIHLDGQTLSAWCALDTLFLPELLGAAATVTSRSPVSDAEISLTVTPAGPSDVQPPQAVVSLLLPEGEFGADVIQRFCHFVHFFTSPEDTEAWTAEHPGTFLIGVEDAYRLGQRMNQAVFGDALAPAAAR